MKYLQIAVLCCLVGLTLAGVTLGQDAGVRDTCRYQPENATWTINDPADLVFSIELLAWSDHDIQALSLGFKFPINGGDGTSHYDSLIVVDTFVFFMSADIVAYAFSALDSASYPNSNHSEFNGCLLGLVNIFLDGLFPLNTPSKVGDLLIKIPNPTLLPCVFDISIDSTFFPPAGTFKFSPVGHGMSGFPPEYVGATIHVVNNLCTPGEQPTIGLDPTSFTFDAVGGGANPSTQTLNITNTGSGTLYWAASDNQAWLSLTPNNGIEDGSTVLSVDITGLTAGTYNGTVTISDPSATNNPQTVPVTLNIAEPPPFIVLDPSSFTFDAYQNGVNPDDDTLWVSNGGGDTLEWTAGDDAAWLTIAPVEGSGDGYIVLSTDISGLPVGTYVAVVSVADPAASNDPETVAVTLSIAPPPPVIGLDPSSFYFEAMAGGIDPGKQALSVQNIGAGTLNWTSENRRPWLRISPGSGTDDGLCSLEVSIWGTFTIGGLPPGLYEDTIIVSDPAAANNPQKVPVSLHVLEFTSDRTLIPGDVDLSGVVDIDDAISIIGFIFGGSTLPGSITQADSDCSDSVDIDDVVWLINYVFGGGPAPCSQ